jgi:DNA recombination protein RmuC
LRSASNVSSAKCACSCKPRRRPAIPPSCSSSRPRRQLEEQGLAARHEQARSLLFADSMNQRMLEVRVMLETKIKDLQADNGARLEEMRKTVDEKLHATLESRLTASFQQVSERLERVHRPGRDAAAGHGRRRSERVLTNVKTRGTWGEVQLEMLLEQVLTPDQYAKNVETIAGGARVEFALKLPGQSDNATPVWMPIDAKFPKEQYERLLEAADSADAEGVGRPGANWNAVRTEAKTIAESTSRRRTPPTLPFCSCRPKACMRK